MHLNFEIRLFDWDGFLLSSEIIDDMSTKFTNKYIEFAKMYIPDKTITIRPNGKSWFNSSIISYDKNGNDVFNKNGR